MTGLYKGKGRSVVPGILISFRGRFSSFSCLKPSPMKTPSLASRRVGAIRCGLLLVPLFSQALWSPVHAEIPAHPPLLEFTSGLPGKQVRLTWPSTQGTRYRIEKSTTLATGGTGGWTQVALVEASGAASEWVDPEATVAKAFYRVSLSPYDITKIDPPLLSSAGGTIFLYGQGFTEECVAVIGRDLSAEPLRVGLRLVAPGVWALVFEGTFTPGEGMVLLSIEDAAGTTLLDLHQPVTVTGTGFAEDSPPVLPPVAKTWQPGQPVYGNLSVADGSITIPILDNDNDMDMAARSGYGGDEQSNGFAATLFRTNSFNTKMGIADEEVDMVANPLAVTGSAIITKNPMFQAKGTSGTNPLNVERIRPSTTGRPGEVALETVDLVVSTPAGPDIAWIQTYRSAPKNGNIRWGFCNNMSVQMLAANGSVLGNRIILSGGNGTSDTLYDQPDGTYQADGLYLKGSFTSGKFILQFADGGSLVFHGFDRSPLQGKLEEIRDPNGIAVTCSYNGVGVLQSLSSQFGQSITCAYDFAGRISTLTDHTGRFVTYAYYAAGESGGAPGDLKSISPPQESGQPPVCGPVTFTYTTGNADPNLNGNLLTITDGAGRTLESFTYSPQTDPNAIDYDTCASTSRNKTGHVTLNRREIVPPTPASPGGYDIHTVDEVGRVCVASYDKLHRPTRTQQLTGFSIPGVPVTSVLNLPAGKLRPTDPYSFITSYEYNADSACTKITYPDGSQEITVFDRDFRKNCPVLERGNARVMTLRAPGGESRTVTCDYLAGYGESMPIRIIKNGPGGTFAATGIRDFQDLDSDNDAFAAVSRNGVATGASAGAGAARGISGGAIAGIVVACRQSPPKPVRMVTAHGQIHSWTYDTHGNCTGAISPVPGKGSLYQYNSLGQCTGVTVLDGANPSLRAEFTYDAATAFLSHVIRDKTTTGTGLQLTTQYDRDPLGRVSRIVDPNGQDWLYAYNALDRCIQTSGPMMPNRISMNMTIDTGGLLARVDIDHLDGDGKPVAANPAYSTFYVYDDHAALSRIAVEERPVDCSGLLVPDTAGIQNFAVEDYTRDDAGQVIRVSTPAACRGQAVDLACDSSYDERGLLYRSVEGGAGSPGAVITQFDYDTCGAPTRCAILASSGTSPETTFTYDGFHRPAGGFDPMGNETRYVYDNQGFVTCTVLGELNDVAGSAGNVPLARLIKKAAAWISAGAPNNSVAGGSGGGLLAHEAAHTVQQAKVRADKDKIAPRLVAAALLGSKVRTDKDKIAPRLVAAALLGSKVRADKDKIAPRLVAAALLGSRFASSSAFFCVETEDDTTTVQRFTPGTSGQPVNEVTVIDCSPSGLVRNITVNGDLLVSCTYDSAGRPLRWDGTTWSCRYSQRDSNGNVLESIRTDHSTIQGAPSRSFTSTFGYDAMGRCIQSSDSVGNTATCKYDSLDRITECAEPGGTQYLMEYDGGTAAQPFSARRSVEVSGEFVHEANVMARCGRPVSETDSNGYSTTYTRDSQDRLTRCAYPDGTFETWSFDGRGALAQTTLPHGAVCTPVCNDGFAVTSVTWSSLPAGVAPVPQSTYAYNGMGLLVGATQGGSVVTKTFDSCGNELSETTDGRTITRTFNHRGRTGVIYQDGRRFIEARDHYGNLRTLSAATAGGAPISPPIVTEELLGNRVSRSTTANGVVTNYLYRGDGDAALPGLDDHSFDACVQTSITGPAGQQLGATQLARDGNQRTCTCNSGYSIDTTLKSRAKTFTRDFRGDIISSVISRRDSSSAPTVVENEVSYTRAFDGRRLSVTGGQHPGIYTSESTLPPGDLQMSQYTSWPRGPLAWSDDGNLTSMATPTATLSFSYDAEGKLLSVGDGTGQPVVTYAYDALGRRAARTGRNPQTGKEMRYMYDGVLPVQELAQDGIADRSYVYGRGASQWLIITRTGLSYTPHQTMPDNEPEAPGTAVKVGSVLGSGGKLPKLTSIGALATSLGRVTGTGGKLPKLTSIGALATSLGRVAGGPKPKLTSVGSLATALGRSAGQPNRGLQHWGDRSETSTHGDPHTGSSDESKWDVWGDPHENLNGIITASNGSVLERYDCDDAGKPIFLTSDGVPSSTGMSTLGLRWMAPGSFWDEDVRLTLTPGGAYSPLLGMSISCKRPPGMGGHVTILK